MTEPPVDSPRAFDQSDSGASLVLVIALLVFVGITGAAILAFSSNAIVRSSITQDSVRDQSDIDSSVEVAINNLRNTNYNNPAAACPEIEVPGYNLDGDYEVTCTAENGTGIEGVPSAIVNNNNRLPHGIIATAPEGSSTGGVVQYSGEPFQMIGGVLASASIDVTEDGAINSEVGSIQASECVGLVTSYPATDCEAIDAGSNAPAYDQPEIVDLYPGPGFPTAVAMEDINPDLPECVAGGSFRIPAGYYTSSQLLQDALDNCDASVFHLEAGATFFFDFRDESALTIPGGVTVVAGQPNGWTPGPTVSTPSVPGACISPTADRPIEEADNQGTQIVVGHDSRIVVDGNFEVCGPYSADNPPISIFGATDSEGPAEDPAFIDPTPYSETLLPSTSSSTSSTTSCNGTLTALGWPQMSDNTRQFSGLTSIDSLTSGSPAATANNLTGTGGLSTSCIQLNGFAPTDGPISAGTVAELATIQLRDEQPNPAYEVAVVIALRDSSGAIQGSPFTWTVGATPTASLAYRQLPDALGFADHFRDFVDTHGYSGAQITYAVRRGAADGTPRFKSLQLTAAIDTRIPDVAVMLPQVGSGGSGPSQSSAEACDPYLSGSNPLINRTMNSDDSRRFTPLTGIDSFANSDPAVPATALGTSGANSVSCIVMNGFVPPDTFTDSIVPAGTEVSLASLQVLDQQGNRAFTTRIRIVLLDENGDPQGAPFDWDVGPTATNGLTYRQIPRPLGFDQHVADFVAAHGLSGAQIVYAVQRSGSPGDAVFSSIEFSVAFEQAEPQFTTLAPADPNTVGGPTQSAKAVCDPYLTPAPPEGFGWGAMNTAVGNRYAPLTAVDVYNTSSPSEATGLSNNRTSCVLLEGFRPPTDTYPSGRIPAGSPVSATVLGIIDQQAVTTYNVRARIYPAGEDGLVSAEHFEWNPGTQTTLAARQTSGATATALNDFLANFVNENGYSGARVVYAVQRTSNAGGVSARVARLSSARLSFTQGANNLALLPNTSTADPVSSVSSASACNDYLGATGPNTLGIGQTMNTDDSRAFSPLTGIGTFANPDPATTASNLSGTGNLSVSCVVLIGFEPPADDFPGGVISSGSAATLASAVVRDGQTTPTPNVRALVELFDENGDTPENAFIWDIGGTPTNSLTYRQTASASTPSFEDYFSGFVEDHGYSGARIVYAVQRQGVNVTPYVASLQMSVAIDQATPASSSMWPFTSEVPGGPSVSSATACEPYLSATGANTLNIGQTMNSNSSRAFSPLDNVDTFVYSPPAQTGANLQNPASNTVSCIVMNGFAPPVSSVPAGTPSTAIGLQVRDLQGVSSTVVRAQVELFDANGSPQGTPFIWDLGATPTAGAIYRQASQATFGSYFADFVAEHGYSGARVVYAVQRGGSNVRPEFWGVQLRAAFGAPMDTFRTQLLQDCAPSDPGCGFLRSAGDATVAMQGAVYAPNGTVDTELSGVDYTPFNGGLVARQFFSNITPANDFTGPNDYLVSVPHTSLTARFESRRIVEGNPIDPPVAVATVRFKSDQVNPAPGTRRTYVDAWSAYRFGVPNP